jgi:tetratricopeptide (TPR) repeat protein
LFDDLPSSFKIFDWTMNSEEEKEKGNNFFKQKNYQQALIHYTNAIMHSEQKNIHVYFTNRSFAYFQLKNFEKSLEDANNAIKIDFKWNKAHFRKTEALIQLKKFHEAQHSFHLWKNLVNLEEYKKEMNDLNLKLQKEKVNFDFSIIAKDLPQISVKFIDEIKGKGVFSNNEFKFGDLIFLEEPLVSHRCVDDKKIDSCSHCLRTFLPPKKAFPFDKYFIKENYQYIKNPISCDSCLELYCSEVCKKTSFAQYHHTMCSRNDSQSPMIKLKELSKKLNRTNPLLISKMFGMISERMNQFKDEEFGLEKSTEIFDRFIQNEEFHEQDEECLRLIKEHILNYCNVNNIEKRFPAVFNQ